MADTGINIVVSTKNLTGDEFAKIGAALKNIGDVSVSTTSVAGAQFQNLFGKIVGGVTSANLLSDGLKKIGQIGVDAFQMVAGAMASFVSAGFETAASLEKSTLQFTTLMGNADQAKEHVRGLFDFAKNTPFETGPIIEASLKLQTFGGAALNTKDNLTLLGDASAATGAPIQDLGFWVGRLYSNLQGGKPFGEAAMRLQELAVLTPQARQAMEDLQKSGASADDVFKTFTASLDQFGGAMAKQAGTWDGVMSTFRDSVNLMAGEVMLPFFELVRDGLANINSVAASKAAEEWVTGFAGAIRGAITDVQEANRIMHELGVTWSDIGTAAINSIPGLQGTITAFQSLRDYGIALIPPLRGVLEVLTVIKESMGIIDAFNGKGPQVKGAGLQMAEGFTASVDAMKLLGMQTGQTNGLLDVMAGGGLKSVGTKINELRLALANLTTEQKSNIASLKELGQSTAEISKETGVAEDVVSAYVKALSASDSAQKKTAAEAKKLADDLRRVTDTLAEMESARLWPSFIQNIGVAGEDMKRLSGTMKLLAEVEMEVATGAATGAAKFAELGFAAEDAGVKVDGFAKAWKKALGDLSSALSDLAQTADGTFGDIARGAATIVTAMNAGAQAGTNLHDGFKDAGKGGEEGAAGMVQLAAGAMAAVAAMDAATSSASTFSNVIGGAMTGASIGSAAGPWGTAIGAVVGGLVGGLRSAFNHTQKDIERAVQDTWGVAISDGLLKSISDTAKKINSEVAATLLSLSAIIKESGGVMAFGFELATQKAHDLFSMIETGKLSVKDAGAVFDDVFGQLADALIESGDLASETFLDLIRLNQQFGTNSAAVAAFVSGQMQSAFGGLKQFIDNAAFTSKEGAAGMVGALVEVIGEIGWGTKDAQDLIDRFQTALKQAGIKGGAAFSEIAAMAAYAGQEIVGKAVTATTGLDQVMVGLRNTNRLTETSFSGIARQVYDIYRGLELQGQGGVNAYQSMAGPLQHIWELQQDTGWAVDEVTQNLINQAVEAGIVGESHRSASDKIVKALDQVINKLGQIVNDLGRIIPAAGNAAKAAEGVGTAAEGAASDTASAASSMVQSWQSVKNAAELAAGASPTGVELYQLRVAEAAMDTRVFGDIATAVFGDVKGSAEAVGWAVAAAIDDMEALSKRRISLDQLLDTISDPDERRRIREELNGVRGRLGLGAFVAPSESHLESLGLGPRDGGDGGGSEFLSSTYEPREMTTSSGSGPSGGGEWRVEVPLNVDGRELARAVIKYFPEVLRDNGVRIR